jgi:hypothetical protein
MAIFRFGKVYSSNYFCSDGKLFRLRCRHEGQHPTVTANVRTALLSSTLNIDFLVLFTNGNVNV